MSIEDIRRIKAEGGKLPEKKFYSMPKVSKKRMKLMEAEKERLGGNDSDLVRWFKGRMKLLTGKCSECGLSVETKIYRYAINSICHILAKRDAVCPSVKYHIANWIELCPHHHDLFDKSSWEEKEKWGCWPVIQERLIMVYPNLAPEERRHFPESVIKYMKKHSPFNEP